MTRAFGLFLVSAAAALALLGDAHATKSRFTNGLTPAFYGKVQLREDIIVNRTSLTSLDFSHTEGGRPKRTRTPDYARVQVGEHTLIIQWSKGHEPAIYRLGPRQSTTQLIANGSGRVGGHRAASRLLQKAVQQGGTIIPGPDTGSQLVIRKQRSHGKIIPAVYYVTDRYQGPAWRGEGLYSVRLPLTKASALTYTQIAPPGATQSSRNSSLP